MSTIISAIISLIGIVITAFITKNQTMAEMNKKIAVIDEKLLNMGNDLREHNHYAKLYQENVPVIMEKLKVTEHRLEDLERANKQ